MFDFMKSEKIRRNCKYAVLILGIAIITAGCGNNGVNDNSSGIASYNGDGKTLEEASRQLFAMDTVMTITAYGDNADQAVEDAAGEIERLDVLLSTENEKSEIYALNKKGTGELSKDGIYLVEKSIELWENTGGAFDITIYPIMQAWGFTTKDYRVPAEDELEELLSLVNSGNINVDETTDTVSFAKEGMQIDLGGIAKGYASQQIMEIFNTDGIESGIVNLGGNVQVLGKKPDGSEWKIAIENPKDTDSVLGYFEGSDVAVVTSGGYERYFEEDGKSYHHIIDPSTGYPADTGIISVTIVAPDGTEADGLSTSLFVMGVHKAEDYWRNHREEFQFVIQDESGKLYITSDLAEKFKTEFEVEIVK